MALAQKRKALFVVTLAFALVVVSVGAQGAGVLNTSSGGYLVCINSKTKVVTHSGKSSCPKGSKKLVLGAQGAEGIKGATGLSGKDGRDGLDGKTLWNGVKDPENSWGAPGDMFINSVTKTLFGPKDLTTGWPAGVIMVGATGATGATGAVGPSGPGGANGGSGPAGATGATGPAGAAGSSATLTCAQGGTCVVGDSGPGGGKVFYVQSLIWSAPWRYLEVAPISWYDGTQNAWVNWCDSNVFVYKLSDGTRPTTPATGTVIGSGFSNTVAMVRTCAGGAGNLAASYHGGGKSDWFLPSKDELSQLYLQRTVVGGIDSWNPTYWSSSEDTATKAFYRLFSDGTWGSNTKSTTQWYVRPVRAF